MLHVTLLLADRTFPACLSIDLAQYLQKLLHNTGEMRVSCIAVLHGVLTRAFRSTTDHVFGDVYDVANACWRLAPSRHAGDFCSKLEEIVG